MLGEVEHGEPALTTGLRRGAALNRVSFEGSHVEEEVEGEVLG